MRKGNELAAEKAKSADSEAARVNITLSRTVVASSDPCGREIHLDNADPGEVNKLRRNLASEDPLCFEHRFLDFATYFRNQIGSMRKHLNLHIPRLSGSSLCKLAKLVKKEIHPSNNCWEKLHFPPLWCCFKWMDRVGFPANNTCEAFDKDLKEFTMNENYLDYPLCMNHRLYSILLRNPVDRAMSQERHYMAYIKRSSNKKASQNVITGRLHLLRKNYLTWSLTSGLVSGINRLEFVPSHKHLTAAKETLLRMDFLLEIAPPWLSDKRIVVDATQTECLPTMLKLMGFGNATMNKTNEGQKEIIPLKFNKSQYHRWNTLDTQLYQYATKLAKLDCNFFLRIEKEENDPS
jgi:hypothetical protein